MAPIRVPMVEDMTMTGKQRLISLQDGSTLVTFWDMMRFRSSSSGLSSRTFFSFTISSTEISTCENANRPISSGISGSPPIR